MIMWGSMDPNTFVQKTIFPLQRGMLYLDSYRIQSENERHISEKNKHKRQRAI